MCDDNDSFSTPTDDFFDTSSSEPEMSTEDPLDPFRGDDPLDWDVRNSPSDQE